MKRSSPPVSIGHLVGVMFRGSVLSLRPCRSPVRILPDLCRNQLHDSRIRHPLSAPVSGDRTGCRQASPYREGFCGSRSELAVADRHRHGLCDLVRRRSRPRDFRHLCEGRVTRCCCRSLRVEPCPDSGWAFLCPPFLSDEPLDRRRLLSFAIQPRCRGFLCRLYCHVLSRMGGCAVQSVWTRAEYGHGGCRESAGRDGDWRSNRSGLYDVRRHVLRRDSGLCPNLCDHRRTALYCLRGEW